MKEYVSAGNGREIGITYITVGGDDRSGDFGRICESLDFGDLRLHMQTFDTRETDMDPKQHRAMVKSLKDTKFAIMNVHGEPSAFKKFDDLKDVVREDGASIFLDCFLQDAMAENRPLFRGTDREYADLHKYLALGGPQNRRSLVLYVFKMLSGRDMEIPEAVVERAQGVYHKGFPRDITLDDYLKTLDPSKPTVGVMIGQHSWLNGTTDPHDRLIGFIEDLGANTLPVFVTTTPDEMRESIGASGVIDTYFQKDGKRLVDSIVLCGFGFSTIALSTPSDGSIGPRRNFFQDLDVPALGTYSLYRPQEIWEQDGLGMEGGEIAIGLAMPEVDGQLTAAPFVFTEKDENNESYYSWRDDRLKRTASMAVRWARAGRKPKSERKVSILFNGSALSNGGLGSAGGLDTFESVCNLLKRMAEEGYTVDRVPTCGRDILDEMLAALTTCLEWNTEDEIPKKATDMVSVDRYMEWVGRLNPEPYDWVCRSWGQPPGEIMSHDGRFVIPGIMNGNVYIGMEPERGKHAKAESLIHDPNLPTPHSYLTYYRWISEVFGTDVHIHIGTHGSCEWLPGKGNGLSADCFPDIMMDDMPHLYLYIIDDPSEGIVAKRRKRSVLVDHMIPSLTRADTYDELMELEGHIQSYLFSKQTLQKAKMESESQEIYDLIARMTMWKELGLEEGCTKEEVASKCEVIFDYIGELKDNLITDGLHIAGNVPEGRHMDEMVYCLTRLKNGSNPSLRAGIADWMGYDLDALLDNTSGMDTKSGMLNGMVVDDIDDRMQDYIREMHEAGFDREACMGLAKKEFGSHAGILQTTDYICSSIHPGICGIVDEINNMIHGMDGGFIPPGPSGAPTRGNAHLLPTGKNYFALDPESVPTPESWKVGCKMADQMIADYIDREGKYPENVGIVVWSIDTMKTGGDDTAYILYLMGIRPKWGSIGSKVSGLEIIPLEELGRPRIDVTVRISSLFRDTFPNLFQMIDEAVEMIANLDESEEENYLRKHLREDVERMIRSGMKPSEAEELASIRVFGEPPGTHGAGVDILIESSKWDSTEDLAQIYITCGCSAYGRKWRGESQPELFRNRILNMDVAVKNQVDREFDLIDADDGYAYLGGMNAVCRAAGKEKPVNYVGDSSDPDRLKLRDLEKEMAFIVRSKILNPKWIEGLKEHGFLGANVIHDNINHAFGWDATSDVIEDWMYDEFAEKFIFDEENRKWMQEVNPYRYKDIIENLLEAYERDMWEADPETLERLRDLYLETEGMLEDIANDNRA